MCHFTKACRIENRKAENFKMKLVELKKSSINQGKTITFQVLTPEPQKLGLRARSQPCKSERESEKIKEQAEQIGDINSNIKEKSLSFSLSLDVNGP